MVDRSAAATVKGFLAQAVRTADLWLQLPETEFIVCEGVEDADRIGVEIDVHHQFKELTSRVSVASLRGVLTAFLEGYRDSRLHGRRAQFIFISPAELRGAPTDTTLLRAWHSLNPAQLAADVRAHYANWKPTNLPAIATKKSAMICIDVLDETSEWQRFQSSIRWDVGAQPFELLELNLLKQLADHPRIGVSLSQAALGVLVHEVLRASSQKDAQDRQLTAGRREELLAGLNDATRAKWVEELVNDVRSAFEHELAVGALSVHAQLSRHAITLPRKDLVQRIANGVQEKKRILVVGPRGVGKTHLVAKAIDGRPVIWLDALPESGTRTNERLAPKLRESLGAENGVLVVDGVEMAKPEQLEQLSYLATQMPTTAIVVTVRALTRELDLEIELALRGPELISVPPVAEDELDALSTMLGNGLPGEAVRPLVRSLYFFWLAQDLQAFDASSERALLKQLWAARELTGSEAGFLKKAAERLLSRQARRTSFDEEQRDVFRTLISKGFLVDDQRNPFLMGFAHDVLLDFAIAHHVLAKMAADGELVDWLKNIAIRLKSWCLPSIAFEAERCFAHDPHAFWATAYELAHHSTLSDWLIGAKSMDANGMKPLLDELAKGDERAAVVFGHLASERR